MARGKDVVKEKYQNTEFRMLKKLKYFLEVNLKSPGLQNRSYGSALTTLNYVFHEIF